MAAGGCMAAARGAAFTATSPLAGYLAATVCDRCCGEPVIPLRLRCVSSLSSSSSSSSPMTGMPHACGCATRSRVPNAVLAVLGADRQKHAGNVRSGLRHLEDTLRTLRAHTVPRRGLHEPCRLLQRCGVKEGAERRRRMRGVESCSRDCWFAFRKQRIEEREISSAGATSDSDDCARSESIGTYVLLALLAWRAESAEAVTVGPDLVHRAVLLPDRVYGDVSTLLESGLQLAYLAALLILLGGGTFLVVRQILVRRELENAAKELQLRVRSGEASSQEYFDLGAVMLRKKLYVQANKYLEQAIKKWEGDEADLAQVYNALGFSYFSEGKSEQAAAEYEKALKLQPGYITALNNLGDALEKLKKYDRAWEVYGEVLSRDPDNRIAKMRFKEVQEKRERRRGVEVKD
ncbi:hypothetical protein CBR_g38402 [Chara braunii]|uniref:Uncharacterized protein n=1 Tax=Chara braunii TaxID=69332 RepID=A0A388JNM6_CHABU|nr:hypothetical protein CBR_g38402 [Chara braunii]|eukprot:GBG59375.1 hypothetical protein CBR_g38402 [Chara braunii]